MEPSAWVERSIDLASHLADEASGKLANRRVNNEEKLKFLRRAAGFSCNRKTPRSFRRLRGELSRIHARGSSRKPWKRAYVVLGLLRQGSRLGIYTNGGTSLRPLA